MGKTIAQGYYEEGIEKGFEKGELKGVQKTILRQGQIKFGEPDESIQNAIRSTEDTELLLTLADRILIASSWSDLLKSP